MKEGRHAIHETTTSYYYDKTSTQPIEVKHHFDAWGNHRLEIEDKLSNWEIYGGFCILKYKALTFVACTEYWSSSLPEIFVCIKVKDQDLVLLEEEENDTSTPEG